MLLIRKINNILNSRKYYNHYYNQIIKKYKNIDSYTAIFNNVLQQNNSIGSKTPIRFSDDIQFGDCISKVKKGINTSYRFIKNVALCDIIFFTTKVGGYIITTELHFFKNKLIFFKYTFPSLLNKKRIEKLIKRKYLIKESVTNNINNLLVTDSFNSYLKTENEVTFSIYYISKNYGFYDFLKQHQETSKLNILNQYSNSESQLLEKI
ncbi:hypothetical protein [uncultured Tenacibaculum sp.]|uniref:hypothetical protein n=1 Tax=uncultured Tenacibaculum sp. TaxID=174713 RepID=UPI0026270530|nr:hypothetical protein [uncultured Tenacibaculum sp.]